VTRLHDDALRPALRRMNNPHGGGWVPLRRSLAELTASAAS
jgi:hypothetical protein